MRNFNISRRKSWNKDDRDFQTRMNQYKIDDARKFIDKIDNDPNKEERLKRQICKVCFYSSRLAGQAFTNSNCEFCDKEMTFPNTDTDKLCQECAHMNHACKHCGGKMDE